MKATTYGTRITAAHALVAMIRDHQGIRGEVQMTHAESGDRRAWLTETDRGQWPQIVSANLVEGGADLMEIAADYWRDYSHATSHDRDALIEQGCDADELDEETAQELIAADAKLCDLIEEAIREARAEGWRIDAISCDTPSGRSEWTRATGQISFNGTRGSFFDCHRWASSSSDVITPRYPNPVWRVVESDVPWMAPQCTAHDLAHFPATCLLHQHATDAIASDPGAQWVPGLRAARRLAREGVPKVKVLRVLAQVVTGRTREILLDAIEGATATQELPAVQGVTP